MSQELSLRQKAIRWKQAGRSGQLDLSTIGTQPGMVLQMVEPLSVGRSQRTARPLACSTNQSASLVGRNSSSDPGYPRSLDAASRSTGALSVGGSRNDPPRIGVSGLRAFAIDPDHRTRVAARRPHLASVSTRTVCQLEQLSHDPGDAQQPATSAGSDWTSLPERIAAGSGSSWSTATSTMERCTSNFSQNPGWIRCWRLW